MNEQNNKASPKLDIRRSEISSSLKSRPVSKSGSMGRKAKREVPTYNKKVGSSPPEPASRNCFGKCSEDQVKLKLLELTPRNPAKETSEGVQEFIKQVSNFIEKKNPFKDKVMFCSPSSEKNSDPDSYDSVIFSMMDKSLQEIQKLDCLKNITLDTSYETPVNENVRSCVEKPSWEKSHAGHILKENAEGSLGTKKSKTNNFARKTDPSDKKNQKEPFSNTKGSAESNSFDILNGEIHFQNESDRRRVTTPRSREKTGDALIKKQNQTKRKKPSEIPLSKNRIGAMGKAKPLSLLLQKPLKDVESTFSLDFCSKKKSFSPVEELSLCSEIQITINAVSSSERLSESDKLTAFQPSKRSALEEETSANIKLDRCCKSPNIPAVSELPNNKQRTREELSAEKKPKVHSLEKVRTSSFTVLRTKTTVLNRLESLHKRNVSAKENTFFEKRSPSKSRGLISKSSFNSLKDKGSKKNLSVRLSSKGNKPGLKMKSRKTKKENEEILRLPKKRPQAKIKTPTLCTRKEATATRKVGCLIPDAHKTVNPINESSKSRQNDVRTKYGNSSLIKSLKVEGKSLARRAETPAEKKEYKAASSAKSVISKVELENLQKPDTPKSYKSSTSSQKLSKLFFENENGDKNNTKLTIQSKPENLIPTTPPPTPVNSQSNVQQQASNDKPSTTDGLACSPVDENSVKTGDFDGKFDSETSLWGRMELDSGPKPEETEENTEKIASGSKDSEETIKTVRSDLFIRETSLNFAKDEPPEKPEVVEPVKIKIPLKIDLKSQENNTECDEAEDHISNIHSFDWLFTNDKNYTEKLTLQKADMNGSEREKVAEEKKKNNQNVTADSLPAGVMVEQGKSEAFDSAFKKPRKNCSPLKRRPQCKTSALNLKGVRKKKIRSDAGDRRLPSCGPFFNSDLSLQNKTKPDTKVRSSLTKSYSREEQRDIFDDVNAVKLRRRNSEPHSFRGYIWKRIDFVTPRGHKPSVSSMASSLRHLNTDDIDDFAFWEPVPQKMTSCWEMSLYHFKKPWTVLSRSVFRDNRQSNTPGLILENLRNGGSLNTRRSPVSQNERVNRHKENPFDVEPSIAQKNIDIRNWLAALNFPTPPSTSTDVITEGSFSAQSATDAQNSNKTQVSPKRRKVLSNLKFAEEAAEIEVEDGKKYKTSTKWDASETKGLMELIRRKSGGFVTKEQFMDSEHSVRRPNVTVNLCVYSKSVEDKSPVLREASDRNIASEPTVFKSLEVSSQSEISVSATIVEVGSSALDGQSVHKFEYKEKPLETAREENRFNLGRLLKGELNLLPSDVNVWKYLFIFTLFIIILHYCFLSSSMCRN